MGRFRDSGRARYGGEGVPPDRWHSCTLACELLGCTGKGSYPRREHSDNFIAVRDGMGFDPATLIVLQDMLARLEVARSGEAGDDGPEPVPAFACQPFRGDHRHDGLVVELVVVGDDPGVD